MIKERIIQILKETGMTTPELEEATGISRYTWQNIKNKKDREIKEGEIEAILKIFPKYAYWLATGKTIPEAGQTSPELEELARLEQPQKSGTNG